MTAMPSDCDDEHPSIEVVDDHDGAWLVGVELAAKYRVDALVAEGGFGVVYAGHDLRLRVAVAIKLLKHGAAEGDTQRRAFEETFLNEARTVARLRHPNIVRVHDLGVTQAPDGANVPWMAMEWLEGATLQAELKRRRDARGTAAAMSPPQAVALLRPVIEAVAYAHEQGVVHRDIKPANIMLVPGRRGAVPYVLDFGVAKAFAPDDRRSRSGETETGAAGAVGFTAAYAAGEQIARTRTGPWTDVHALALILSELLVGHRVYEGDDQAALLVCALREPRPTPAHFGVSAGALEPVLARALSLKTNERYADAQSLLDAIDAALGAAAGSAPDEHVAPKPLAVAASRELDATTDLERSGRSLTMKPIERPKASRSDLPLRPAAGLRATSWGGLPRGLAVVAALAIVTAALVVAGRGLSPRAPAAFVRTTAVAPALAPPAPGPSVARAAPTAAAPPDADAGSAAAAQPLTPPTKPRRSMRTGHSARALSRPPLSHDNALPE